MTIYYVGVGGNDLNSGLDWANRWLTIGKANTTLIAGDTVYIGPGEWAEEISPGVTGALGSVITYIAYGTGVIITGENDGGGFWHGFRINGKDYITVSGFIFETQGAGTYRWCKIQSSDYVTIQNCTFRQAVEKTSGGPGIWIETSEYNIIRECKFEAWSDYTLPGDGDMIRLYDSNRCLIEDNDFWDAMSPHDAILVEGERNIIRRNIFRNLWQRPVALVETVGVMDCDYSVVEENVFFNSHFCGGFGYKGAQAAADRIIWRRNLFLSNYGQGLVLYCDATYTHCSYHKVYGNIFYYNGIYHTPPQKFNIGCYEFAAGTTGNHIFKNNAIFQGNDVLHRQIYLSFLSGTLNGCEFGGNCIWDADSANTITVNGIKTDSVAGWEASHPANFANNVALNPTFIDPDGFDFNYDTGSPCPTGGVNLTTAVGAGAASTALTAADASYFHDGHGVTSGDWIKIGTADPVQISSINYGTNVITLAIARTWNNADAINLYADSLGIPILTGNTPDIGREWKWAGR